MFSVGNMKIHFGEIWNGCTEKSHTRASLVANIYNLAREDDGRPLLNTYDEATWMDRGWGWGRVYIGMKSPDSQSIHIHMRFIGAQETNGWIWFCVCQIKRSRVSVRFHEYSLSSKQRMTRGIGPFLSAASFFSGLIWVGRIFSVVATI